MSDAIPEATDNVSRMMAQINALTIKACELETVLMQSSEMSADCTANLLSRNTELAVALAAAERRVAELEAELRDERERCAKIAETVGGNVPEYNGVGGCELCGGMMGQDIAAAIRNPSPRAADRTGASAGPQPTRTT